MKFTATGKGMSAGSVRTESFGEPQPVAANATSVGRQENHRVEIAVLLR